MPPLAATLPSVAVFSPPGPPHEVLPYLEASIDVVAWNVGTGSYAEAERVAAAAVVEPVSDFHGSADYRRALVEVLVRRAVEQARSTGL